MSGPHESWAGIVPALVSGGFGAGIAAIAVAVIQMVGKKSESRATAADLITDAAGSLAQRQAETISRLEIRIDRQGSAIIGLTAVLDELLPKLNLDAEEQKKLRGAINAAKMAL